MLLRALVFFVLAHNYCHAAVAEAEGAVDKTNDTMNELVDDVVRSIEGVVIEEGDTLFQTGIPKKEAQLQYQDLGYKIFVKSFPKVRKIWEQELPPKDAYKKISVGLKNSKVMQDMIQKSLDFGNRSKSSSSALSKMKHMAAQLMKTMLMTEY